MFTQQESQPHPNRPSQTPKAGGLDASVGSAPVSPDHRLDADADFELAPAIRLTGTAEDRFHELVGHLRGTHAQTPGCATARCPACGHWPLSLTLHDDMVIVLCCGDPPCDEVEIAHMGQFEVSDLTIEAA